MRAVVLREASFYVEQIPSPHCTDDHTHVRILACALNHRDQYIREGLYSKIQLPAVLGSDICGYTEHGDRVVVDPSINWGPDARAQSKEFEILGMPRQGGLAEEICVPSANVYPAPEHLSDEEAACLPVGGVTAYRAIVTRAQLQKNETVLITGIGGGVATMAMQFALAAGARVLVSSRSADKLRRAEELGAQPVDMAAHRGRVDVIVDSIGGDKLSDYLELAAPGGRIVLYGASAGAANSINLHRVFWKQLSLLGSTMGTPDDFTNMLTWVIRHQIRPVIDSVYTLEEIAAAFERMRAAQQFGKIVIRI